MTANGPHPGHKFLYRTGSGSGKTFFLAARLAVLLDLFPDLFQDVSSPLKFELLLQTAERYSDNISVMQLRTNAVFFGEA